MILALGLGYKDVLNETGLQFARQIGAEGIVVHLIDYVGINLSLDSVTDTEDQKFTSGNRQIWEPENLLLLRRKVEQYGLRLVAIENFDPGSWYDVLLGGPRRDEQLDYLRQCIRNASAAGIHTIHYNFSLAGIWGWHKAPLARGNASSIAFDASLIDPDKPIPDGMVWNMYFRDPENTNTKYLEPVSENEIWDRVRYFLESVLPAAEEAGVALAAHPDDPPLPSLRRTARLINSTEKYTRLLGVSESTSNGINYCLGTTQEMPGADVYTTLENLLKQERVKIVHFRNVVGQVPKYHEVFPDEGDIDMKRIIRILKAYDYRGIIMPDHTPEISCAAPWHAGMAYTMGYLKGLLA